MKKLLIALMTCIVSVGAAQLKLDQQYRDVSPSGPYPIYLRISPPFWQGVGPLFFHEYGNNDFHKGINYYNQQNGTSLKERSVGTGLEAVIGYKFKFLDTQLFTEFSYGQAWARTGDQNQLLTIGNRMYSFRVGIPLKGYYPLSFQLFAGFVLGENYFIIDNNSVRKTFVFRGSHFFTSRQGLELGGRIVFFDPAASSGGLGLSFDLHYVYFAQDYSYEPFVRYVNPTSSFNYVSDNQFISFSINFIAPVGLKL